MELLSETGGQEQGREQKRMGWGMRRAVAVTRRIFPFPNVAVDPRLHHKAVAELWFERTNKITNPRPREFPPWPRSSRPAGHSPTLKALCIIAQGWRVFSAATHGGGA